MENQQYETISKFDRAFAGLQGGNNLPTKPSTIEYIEPITGDAETYQVQTVRAEYKVQTTKGWESKTETRVGNFIVLKFIDKHGVQRLIIPPRVADTIARQDAALTAKTRSNKSKAAMRERMANGYVPQLPPRVKKGSV